VFLLAGALGVLMIAPMYLEDRFVESYPPKIDRPEFYYGFVGVTLAWQFVYLLIGSDPVRYRPLMLLAALAKGSFAVAMPILYLRGRVAGAWVWFGSMDGAWVVLFLVAYLLTPKRPPGGA
jgi:hypothetical protein